MISVQNLTQEEFGSFMLRVLKELQGRVLFNDSACFSY